MWELSVYPFIVNLSGRAGIVGWSMTNQSVRTRIFSWTMQYVKGTAYLPHLCGICCFFHILYGMDTITSDWSVIDRFRYDPKLLHSLRWIGYVTAVATVSYWNGMDRFPNDWSVFDGFDRLQLGFLYSTGVLGSFEAINVGWHKFWCRAR
jgi:hypothetical protein